MSQPFDYLIDTTLSDVTPENYVVSFDKVFRKATSVELLSAQVTKTLYNLPAGCLSVGDSPGTLAVATGDAFDKSYTSGAALATALTSSLGWNVAFDVTSGRLEYTRAGTARYLQANNLAGRMALGLTSEVLTVPVGTVASPNMIDLTYPRYLKLVLAFNNMTLNGVVFPRAHSLVGSTSTPKATVMTATYEVDMQDANFAEVSHWFRNTRYDQRTAPLSSAPDFDTISVRWARPDGTWLEPGEFGGIGHQLRVRVHSSTNPHR